MGLLMEEMLGKWNNSKLEISQVTSKWLELDMLIMERDIMDMWKKIALGVDSLADGDSEKCLYGSRNECQPRSYDTHYIYCACYN